MYSYKTKGVCSREIQFDVENDIIKEVRFIGGCMGNTQGVAALAKGRNIDEVINTIKGIDCGGRGTSCPDQLAKALKEYKKLLIMQTPYRLLSSFLVDVGGNDPIWNRPKDIIETIKDYNEKYRLPYIIENDRGLKRRVVVQPEWRDFLMTNYRVIMEWVHDEKIKYLEKRKIEESAS